MGRMVVTISAIRRYQECPASWYYNYREPEVKDRTDYPRLAGVHIHRHLAQEEKPTSRPRRFYYQTTKASQGVWRNRWNRVTREAFVGQQLLDVDPEAERRYLKIGEQCAALYRKRYERERPIAAEARYSVIVPELPFVTLAGIVDQIRPVTMDWIEEWRPDLVRNGELDPDYLPEVIWDAKTGDMSFDPRQRWREPTPLDAAWHQFPLHNDMQFTFYTLLYQRVKGKLPVACVWYHARSGTEFPTFRGESDYPKLFATIRSYLRGIDARQFEPHPGERCWRCGYVFACQGDKPFLVVRPGSAGEEDGPVELVPNIIKHGPKQFGLKFPSQPRPAAAPPKGPPVAAPSGDNTPIIWAPLEFEGDNPDYTPRKGGRPRLVTAR